MQTGTPLVSKKRLWAGYILSAIPALMLLFSAGLKFAKPPSVVQTMTVLGWGEEWVFALGVLEVACVAVFVVPRTAVLGAILVAAYLGGATATQVRVGEPWFFPVLLGVLAWAGLYLREPRLHALLPMRK
jgi:hypothetical protein